VSACLLFALVSRRGRKFTVRRGFTTLELASSGQHNVRNSPVFWDITSCSTHFGGARLHLQCRTISQQEANMKHVASTTCSELALCHEDLWGSGSRAPAILTSALDGVEWSDSRPSRFSSEARALSTNWMGGWMGPRAVMDSMQERKKFAPPGIEPRSSSPYPVAVPTEIFRLL
jgi:hypothetical protein